MTGTSSDNAKQILNAFVHRKKTRDNITALDAQRLVNQFRQLSVFKPEFVTEYNQQLLNSTDDIRMMMKDILGGPTVRQYFDYLQSQLGTSEDRDENDNTETRPSPNTNAGYLPSPDEDMPIYYNQGPSQGHSSEPIIEMQSSNALTETLNLFQESNRKQLEALTTTLVALKDQFKQSGEQKKSTTENQLTLNDLMQFQANQQQAFEQLIQMQNKTLAALTQQLIQATQARTTNIVETSNQSATSIMPQPLDIVETPTENHFETTSYPADEIPEEEPVISDITDENTINNEELAADDTQDNTIDDEIDTISDTNDSENIIYDEDEEPYYDEEMLEDEPYHEEEYQDEADEVYDEEPHQNGEEPLYDDDDYQEQDEEYLGDSEDEIDIDGTDDIDDSDDTFIEETENPDDFSDEIYGETADDIDFTTISNEINHPDLNENTSEETSTQTDNFTALDLPELPDLPDTLQNTPLSDDTHESESSTLPEIPIISTTEAPISAEPVSDNVSIMETDLSVEQMLQSLPSIPTTVVSSAPQPTITNTEAQTQTTNSNMMAKPNPFANMKPHAIPPAGFKRPPMPLHRMPMKTSRTPPMPQINNSPASQQPSKSIISDNDIEILSDIEL